MSAYRGIVTAAWVILAGCGGAEANDPPGAPRAADGGTTTSDGGVSPGDASPADTLDGAEGRDGAADAEGDGAAGGCAQGELVCGSTCKRVNLDPDNCGACGHSCLGAACTAGRCDAILVATLQGYLTAIAADGTNVYWANGTGKMLLAQQARDGAANSFKPVANLGVGPRHIEVQKSTIFFGAAPGEIDTVPVGGGAVGSLPFGAVDTFMVDATVAHVYMVHSAGIYDCKTDGSNRPCAVLDSVTDQTSTDSIHVSGDYLFWGDARRDVVRRLTLSTGVKEDFAVGQGVAGLVRGDGQNVYWSAVHGHQVVIVRSPVGSATPTDVADASGILDMAVGSHGVFFIAGQQIEVAPATGGPTSVLAQSGSPLNIAIDDVAVYWTDQDGSIRKVARP